MSRSSSRVKRGSSNRPGSILRTPSQPDRSRPTNGFRPLHLFSAIVVGCLVLASLAFAERLPGGDDARHLVRVPGLSNAGHAPDLTVGRADSAHPAAHALIAPQGRRRQTRGFNRIRRGRTALASVPGLGLHRQTAPATVRMADRAATDLPFRLEWLLTASARARWRHPYCSLFPEVSPPDAFPVWGTSALRSSDALPPGRTRVRHSGFFHSSHARPRRAPHRGRPS